MLWEIFLIDSILGGIGLPLLLGWWCGWQDSWQFLVTGLACFAVQLLLFLLFLGVYVLVAAKRPVALGRTPIYNAALQVVRIVNRICRVHFTVTGEELPRVPFLLIANHRSGFDPLVLLEAFSSKTITYISKPENFRIPLIGAVIHRCGFLRIDRENPRKAMATINSAAEQITQHGVSVGVFPEGTRSKDNSLLPFHNGVLKIAQKAHAPLVVVTLQGTELVKSRAPFRRTDVTVQIEEVILPEEFEGQKTAALAERARAAMLKTLEQ